jgi:hypothetical protein
VILLGRLSLYGDRASRLHDQVIAVAAPWVDATVRQGALAVTDEATLEALRLLDRSFAADGSKAPSSQVLSRLTASAAKDLDDLRKQLERQARRTQKDAAATLEKRGAKEAAEMRAILEAQRKRIETTSAKREKEAAQLPLFAEDERRQIEADKRHWRVRLERLSEELTTEPARVRASYEVRATRFEPAGLVYLWPVTG